MNIEKTFVATLFAFAALCTTALANNATLCGSVRAEGHALNGAAVTIESASQKLTVTTNSKGLYCFTGLHVNTHVVRVEKAGYETVISQGFVPVGQSTLHLDFVTKPGDATVVRIPKTGAKPNIAADETADVYIIH